MNINSRFCIQIGHEKVKATHLWIFDDYNLLQRQCCIQCINVGNHNHRKSDQKHIIIKQEIQKDKKKLHYVENDKNIKPYDLSKRKYIIKEIDKGGPFYTANISNNEKYLAYGGFDQCLSIHDIKQYKIIQKIKLNRSLNSHLIHHRYMLHVFNMIITKIILLLQLQVLMFQQILKKIFLYNIQTECISNIITMQNKYFMACGKNKIIKPHLKRNKQIFKLIHHDTQFSAMDQNQSVDSIISASVVRSLQLWDCRQERIIINKESAHSSPIMKLRFINNIQNLLSLDNYYNVYKWRIDLINNHLIKVQEYKDPNYIIRFISINQNQNMLFTCENFVKIIDDKGKTINQIDHKSGDVLSLRFQNKQLDSSNYIHIVSDGIQLLQQKIKSCQLQPYSEVKREEKSYET